MSLGQGSRQNSAYICSLNTISATSACHHYRLIHYLLVIPKTLNKYCNRKIREWLFINNIISQICLVSGKITHTVQQLQNFLVLLIDHIYHAMEMWQTTKLILFEFFTQVDCVNRTAPYHRVDGVGVIKICYFLDEVISSVLKLAASSGWWWSIPCCPLAPITRRKIDLPSRPNQWNFKLYIYCIYNTLADWLTHWS